MRDTMKSFTAWCLVATLLAASLVACEHGDKAEETRAASDPWGVPIDWTIPHDDLEAEADVLIDEWGVPHIYARTDHDAFYLQGYVSARDRFSEMDLARKIAFGRLGEVIGQVVAVGRVLADVVIWELDHNFRSIFTNVEGEHIADTLMEGLDDNAVAILQAYADGVNAFLADALAEQYGAEGPTTYTGFLSIGLDQIEPWTVRDMLGIMVVNLWSGANSVNEEIALGEALAALGPEKFFDFYRSQPDDTTTIIPGAAKSGSVDEGPDMAAWEARAEALREALPALRAARETLDSMRQTFFSPGQHSNNWAVDAEHSATGNTLMANDPHLSMLFPSFFYMVHVDSKTMGEGDVAFAGLSVPMAPGIQIGHNDYVGWTGTNAAMDTYDAYLEKRPKKDKDHVLFNGDPVAIRKFGQVYKNAIDPDRAQYIDLVTQVVPHRGPIVPGSCQGTSCVSLAWTGMEPGNELQAFIDILFATSLDEAMGAFDQYRRGLYSWVLGDVNGDIGYVAVGEVPVRDNWRTQPPYLPMPGTGESEWIGLVPDDAQARFMNPARGFIMSANNDIYGTLADNNPTNDDNYFYYDMDIGYRAGRITRLLESATEGGVTMDEMAAIQTDTESEVGKRFLPHLLTAYAARPDLVDGDMKRAVDQLSSWDYSTPAGITDRYRPEYVDEETRNRAVSATLFHVWLGRTILDVFGDDFDEADLDLPGNGSESGPQWEARALLNLLENEDDTNFGPLWFDDLTTPVVESRDEMLLHGLRHALDFLSEELGPDMVDWEWGRLHTSEFGLNFEGISIPSLLSPTVGPSPADGGWFTINVANPVSLEDDFTNAHGPAGRMVMELDGDRFESWAVLPGGQVERPDSAFFDSLHDEYMNGRYVPLLYTLEEILPATVERLKFVPAGK